MTSIARFTLGCEMREERYWEGKEERKCRLCAWEKTWEHVVEVCMREEEEGEGKILSTLKEDGKKRVE